MAEAAMVGAATEEEAMEGVAGAMVVAIEVLAGSTSASYKPLPFCLPYSSRMLIMSRNVHVHAC